MDDWYNGVGLPIDFHQGLHKKGYYDRVNEASDGWKTLDDAISSLRDIAKDLTDSVGP